VCICVCPSGTQSPQAVRKLMALSEKVKPHDQRKNPVPTTTTTTTNASHLTTLSDSLLSAGGRRSTTLLTIPPPSKHRVVTSVSLSAESSSVSSHGVVGGGSGHGVVGGGSHSMPPLRGEQETSPRLMKSAIPSKVFVSPRPGRTVVSPRPGRTVHTRKGLMEGSVSPRLADAPGVFSDRLVSSNSENNAVLRLVETSLGHAQPFRTAGLFIVVCCCSVLAANLHVVFINTSD